MSFAQRPEAPEVDTARLADALDEGAVLIDVRMPDEYVEAHVPGAVLIPLPELSERTDEVPTGTQIFVICAGGGRSLAAAAALNNAGWDTVSVAGGTRAWVAEGRPVRTGTDA
ncbi:MAG: rhodanese-like domain-containing protein [Acidimicrobiales bacterium]